jgi:shikimate kinase
VTRQRCDSYHCNIVFIGFASCGKSASGRITAQQLGYRFVDLDEVIEAEFLRDTGRKLTCREIYGSEGAEVFMRCETAALSGLITSGCTVLSTGGGAPMTEANRPLLSQFGLVVYLYAEVPVLLRRMEFKGYPSYLAADPLVENMQRIWDARHAVYGSLADLTVDTDNKTAQEVAMEVIRANEQFNRQTI